MLHMLMEMLLPGSRPAASCQVILAADPFDFELDALRAALRGLPSGQCVAYAVPLEGSAVTRLITLVLLRFRVRRAQRVIASGGVAVVGSYGVDPRLEAPILAYDLNTAASKYADHNLRPRGSAVALRRVIARCCGYDPAVGGVIVIGQKC